MARKLKILICFLVPALLIFISCSTNEAVRSRFEAEKKFHAIEKFLQDSQIQPRFNNPDLLNQIQYRYRDLIDYCVTSLGTIDSSLYPQEFDEIGNIAYFATKQLSQILFANKKYDSCLSLITGLMQSIDLKNYQKMTVYVSIGRALQASGNWDSAIVIYNYSVKNFYPPVAADGRIAYELFNLPLQVHNIYQRTGDSVEAARYFTDAERYYQTLIKDFPETDFYASAHSNLARLYYNTRQWTKTIDQLRYLVDTTGIINPSANMKIADIYAGQLRRLDSALKIYEYVEDHLDDRDTLLKPVILFKKSLVYLEKKDCPAARSELIELENQYPAYYAYYPTPQYTKARSFELEENWARAETEYKFLIENYPGSREAMSTHLYLAEKLAQRGRQLEADRWRRKAESYFDEIARQNRGTIKEATALFYKAELFRREEKWRDAAETMASVFNKFPDDETGRRGLLIAAEIYRQKLDNQPAADSLIELLRKSLTSAEEEWGT